jgi:putative ABC transport system permease protein
MKALIYLSSFLAPRRLRAVWCEEWLAELHAARRAGGAPRAFRFALGAPFDALSSRWTTQCEPGSLWKGPWRSDWLQTVRALRRSPGHVAVVALCLGVGIAVSTTTFSIMNAFTKGELPGVTDRARIGRLHLGGGNSSVVDYEIMREGSPSFAGIAAEGVSLFAMRVEGRAAENVVGAFVAGNYFEVLGTRAHLGRLLHPSDDRADAPLGVVISHGYWTARLGAPADVVGKSLVIGGRAAVITGVAPQGFRGLRGGEMNDGSGFAVYVPLAHVRDWPGARPPGQRWLNVYGRLTVEMDRDRLEAELLPLAARINSATGPAGPGASNLETLRNARIDVTETWTTPAVTTTQHLFFYLAMLSAPLTVLAIGCANVANLQLVRASRRTRELAVRASLGAARGQIVRLLTFEAVLLVIVAFATSALGIWLLLRVAALTIPIPVHLDWRVMSFNAAIAALVIAATGLLPELISTRADASPHLRSGGRSMASGNSRVRRGLVVAQVALCFLLLLSAGVFTRGLALIAGQLPPHAEHTLITQVRFDVQRHYGPAQRRAFLDAFDHRVRADSRVRGIGYTAGGVFSTGSLRVWRADGPPAQGPVTASVYVGGDYFDVSGIRVLRGRPFTSADVAAPTAVVVNEAFIKAFEIPEPVVGQPLRISLLRDALYREEDPSPRHVTIVGVASSPASSGMGDSPGGGAKVYLPMPPSPDSVTAWISADGAGRLADDVRRTIASLDPELAVTEARTLAQLYAESSGPLAMIARTAAGLGIVALLLAVSGLYSVIAFFVALRTSEFGIRLALGARSADIVWLVLGQALRLAGLGLVAGAVLGTPLLIALDANFPFTQPFDPAVVLPTALLLVLTALLAGWVPARRASSIQASEALRAD